LNNDVEILHNLWLSRMLPLAAMPDVGAVGAKLLYSDGRIQHAGVVLGIDGRAGHFQRGLSAIDPGYFRSLGSPHEVSAVTAACMAVEARKFAAVGGFDEINLPVELNDVDLCLRLNARGWKTLLESRATLTHVESASRGANALLDARYHTQVAYFAERWKEELRDDPYFHPALSLDALQAALG
jgi:GT2 family glycosyltransferase